MEIESNLRKKSFNKKKKKFNKLGTDDNYNHIIHQNKTLDSKFRNFYAKEIKKLVLKDKLLSLFLYANVND